MIYTLIRDRMDSSDYDKQKRVILRYMKKNAASTHHRIVQKIADGSYQQLNKKLLSDLHLKDKIIIANLSVLGPTLSVVIDVITELAKKKVTLYSVSDDREVRGSSGDIRIFTEGLRISKEIEKSILQHRAARGLAKRRFMGKVGRPIGSTSRSSKLSSHEEGIRFHLSKKVSIAAIARIYGVSRITAQKFVSRLKEPAEK